MEFLIDPISFLGNWLAGVFTGWGMTPALATTIVKFLGAAILGTFSLVLVVFTIWLERKLYARIQDRLGPNRIGPWGILQTIPDMIKIFTKEYITPDGADKIVYNLAPILSVAAVILIWAVLPLAPTVIGTQINVGVLYIVAVGAIGTLSLIMAGWSSNNKYALLGAFRAVSQMVSYEVPMVVALMIPVLLAGSMGLNSIVEAQNVWFILLAPVAGLMFFISSQAEIGRAPFDLLEAESELVAGYQTEYSGLKFGMFYVGEFLHAFTVSALTVTIFLGGWRGLGAEQSAFLGIAWFFLKTFFVYFFVVVLRISMPRLRIDQLLGFNWKFLTPLALMLLILTALVEKIISELVLPGVTAGAGTAIRVAAHLTLNVMVVWVTIEVLRRSGRKTRMPVAKPRPVAMAPKSQG
jgi:NADH-quinone oxidoreductase subunit H